MYSTYGLPPAVCRTACILGESEGPLASRKLRLIGERKALFPRLDELGLIESAQVAHIAHGEGTDDGRISACDTPVR